MTMNGSLPPSSSTVFLSARPARAATSGARALAAGQRHGADARVIEERRHVRRADQERLEHAVGKPRAPEDVLDGQRALRHVRRVLEEADVAGHQRRRGEAEHLPEREVPGHDGQHDAERLVADVALRALRSARARRRESARRARRSSGTRARTSRASSMPARSGLPISSVISRPSGSDSASRMSAARDRSRVRSLERRVLPAIETPRGALEPRHHLGRRKRVERCERLAGRRVDALQRHGCGLRLRGPDG